MTAGKGKGAKVDPASGKAATGRLAGKVALVTGAAGNLGGAIIRRFIAESATLVMTGRTEERLAAAKQALLDETGVDEARVFTVILDGADPESVRAGIDQVKAALGRIDVLVNNAGSAGPRQTLENVPLTRAEMEANGDSETVADAMRNLLGVSWNLTRAAAPIMPVGGSVVNISTIFSHTRYYGRTAYVVPKAALNALSQELAKELGASGIRVNTVFPGPIESERIRTVFAAMDALQGEPENTTASHFMGRMTLERAVGDAPKQKTLPVPGDIADACLFLASDESAALNGNEIDVTHGMQVRKDSRSTYMARPSMRSLDGAGLTVLIAAGEAWEDALEMAKIQATCGARVLLGMTRQVDVAQAEARVKAQGAEEGLTIMRFKPRRARGHGGGDPCLFGRAWRDPQRDRAAGQARRTFRGFAGCGVRCRGRCADRYRAHRHDRGGADIAPLLEDARRPDAGPALRVHVRPQRRQGQQGRPHPHRRDRPAHHHLAR
jgi:malonyl-CoA reductase/3-hydroxypropionate dehydrogenase (NADP+)